MNKNGKVTIDEWFQTFSAVHKTITKEDIVIFFENFINF